VLLRTTLTWTIILPRLIIQLLGSNDLQWIFIILVHEFLCIASCFNNLYCYCIDMTIIFGINWPMTSSFWINSLSCRAVFNWASKVNSAIALVLHYYTLWLVKILHQYLNQSETKPNPFVTCSHPFSLPLVPASCVCFEFWLVY